MAGSTDPTGTPELAVFTWGDEDPPPRTPDPRPTDAAIIEATVRAVAFSMQGKWRPEYAEVVRRALSASDDGAWVDHFASVDAEPAGVEG